MMMARWCLVAGALMGVGVAQLWAEAPAELVVSGVALAVGVWSLLSKARGRSSRIVRLGGLRWTVEDFCRGWLISGDTGSGKTLSGINQLLWQVFKNAPNWGGLCIDDKGIYHETLLAMARKFGRADDVLLLRVPGNDTERPTHRFNLVGDRSIPAETYGKIVVDTAVALGQNRDQSFFQKQAHDHIARALDALQVLRCEVSLENACHLLVNQEDLQQALRDLDKLRTPTAQALAAHFRHSYVNQPPEQWGGVQSTVANYLQPFLQPAIAELFCRDSTFAMSDIDRGKIICLAIPQQFATERRYVGTFLKTLFYIHAFRRFDRSSEARQRDNLVVLWADEAQQFVTDARDGLSDHNAIDRLREARCAVVMATQSSTSFVPPLGEARARVLTLNLRNRIIFKAADEADAVASADFLGKRKRRKTSWTYNRQGRSRTVIEDEAHKIPSYELRSLRTHRCVLVHCERGFCKTVLPPLEPDGSVCPWFRRWRLS